MTMKPPPWFKKNQPSASNGGPKAATYSPRKINGKVLMLRDIPNGPPDPRPAKPAKPFKGGGGSFGGGGATGSWDAPAPPPFAIKGRNVTLPPAGCYHVRDCATKPLMGIEAVNVYSSPSEPTSGECRDIQAGSMLPLDEAFNSVTARTSGRSLYGGHKNPRGDRLNHRRLWYCPGPTKIWQTSQIGPLLDPARDPNEQRREPALFVPPMPPVAVPPLFGGRSAVVIGPTLPRSFEPASTSPPRGRSKERKGGKWARGAFRAMDFVSEASEMLDCVYDALPKATRKAWEKEHKPEGTWKKDGNRMIDQFGQYGISGADWKGPAIYMFYDQIDLDKMMVCLIKNHLSDKVMGLAQSRKAALTGQNTFGRGGSEQWLRNSGLLGRRRGK